MTDYLSQPRVIIESPFAPTEEVPQPERQAYMKAILQDSLSRVEVPFGSHFLYPQVLDDNIPEHRTQGIQSGYVWMAVADYVVFYIDQGFSSGMAQALYRATELGKPFTLRSIHRAVDNRVRNRDIGRSHPENFPGGSIDSPLDLYSHERFASSPSLEAWDRRKTDISRGRAEAPGCAVDGCHWAGDYPCGPACPAGANSLRRV